MTSLAQQLQRLAVPEARAAAAAQRKDRKSLLFDPAEAGGLDKDTFYAIGVNGLQELQGIDPRFQDFESLLFDEASKSLERSIETREINDRLDKKIRRFLLNVSPYFLLKPAQKAIEWLVYRFHIHEYNTNDLMMCVLPYHETKIFVRAVQLLDLKNKKTKWTWLAPIQKPGVSLSRLSLVTHCISDRGFLHFVCELPLLAIKAQKKTVLPGESPQLPSDAPLRVLFSFYAATLVSTISSPGAVKESFLASILPFLLRGLKVKYLDYNGATYMIICQLGVSSTLKVTLLKPLMEAMCENVNPEMIQQMLGCLAVLCRTQNLKQLPGKVMFQICAMPKFLISLIQLSKSHNITPLLSALLPHLTTTAINAEVSEENQLPEGCKELDLISSLTGVLRETHIESHIVVATARCLLHGYVSACSKGLDDECRTELREKIAPVVQSLERRFPEAMDLILESYLAEIEDHDKQKYIQDFISMYSGGMKHQLLPEANTSLVLSLNHANPDVRRMAVNHIHNLIQKGGEVDPFFQESLLQRLQDDSLAVVGAVLQIDEYLCELLPVDPVFAALQKLLNKRKKKHGNDWNNVVKGAIKVISSQTFVSKAPHLVDDAVTMTIPYIFTTTTTQANSGLELEIRAEITGSHLVHSHPLMKGLKAVLSSKRAVSESKMTTKVLDLLGKNMAALKQEELEKMVSSLLSHLGASSKPEAYRLIVTTLFLRALQHLHGAESKLYMTRKLLAVLEVDALKTCQKNVELIRTEQGENTEEQDGPLQPTGVPSAELPPQLHIHLSTLLTVRRKHRVAGTVYLYSSQVQAMVWALESMVLSLAPSVSSLTPDSKWWVPGTEEGHVGGQFVTFLLQLVDLLTQGSTECHLKDKTKQGFRNIMHSVIKNLFTDSTSFLKLLSVGWIGHVIPSQPMGFKPSPLFQVRCLNMASAIFGSVQQNELSSLLGMKSSVVPCLLMSLSSPLEPVRAVAIGCLQTINDSYHGDSAGPYYWLVQRLLKKKEAIELDSEYIKHALGNSLMKASKVPVITFPKQKKAEASPDVKGASAIQAKQCLEWILEYVKQEGIPHQAQRSLLQLLEEVDSEDLLQDLLVQAFVAESALSVDQTHSLHCILGHMTPQTAHLMSEQKCLDLLLEVLSREKPVCAGLAPPLEMALKQMTGAFFTALPTADIQQTVLARLIDLQVDTNSSVTANQLAKVIKKLPLQASQVVKELSQIIVGQKPKSVKDARRVRQKQKLAKADDTAAQSSTSEGRAWQRVMTILENLQQRKLGKMEGRHTIVPTLFTLLSLCLELPATDQGASEYIKQLLLTTILSICDHLGDVEGEEAGPLITEEQFSVELVVQCIRTSDNPQTHNHALLLLATAAKLFPEHVLHNIMAIFTFMGASLLRQDDSHSFQIIHKTVQTVIPALVKASKDQSLPSSLAGNLEDVVTMVMQTFVDAFPHIPEHRRLPLFTHLVQSVGGAEYLWRVILLLIGGYATKGATAMLPEETETKGPGRNLEFWLTLCHHFDPETQVISLTKMLGYLATLKGKKEGAKTLSHSTRSTRSAGVTPGSKGATSQDLIFDQGSHSPRQLRHFKFTSVGFLSQLLISDPFIAQLVNHSEEKSAAMQVLYQKLLEQTLCYITHVAHCIQDNTDPNTAKFWRALLHKAYDVLDKVNYLLPAKVFIGVVSGLLGNRLPTVRRKAMELLNNKLIQNKDGFEDEETAMLLSMLDTLVTIAKSSRENTTESDELDINRQTALYSLKLLCKLFGSEHRKEFTKVMDVALDVVMETQGNNQVIASGLLCLAEAVSSLKAHAIPYLSRFMPPLIDTLSNKAHATSSDLHLLSTVTAIQKILETLPHFLSPYLGQLLQQVCRLSGDRQDEEKSQLTLRLKACRHQLSTALPPRVLIPAVSECYKTNVSTSQTSIGPLMSVLSDHLDQLPKEDLLSHHHATVSLFLQALDYRSTHTESCQEEVSTIEGHVINAVNTMVMKLSEATFRPMFLKIYEWATRGNNPDRLLTFYRLSDGLAEKLQSLFCLFAGHLIYEWATRGNNPDRLLTFYCLSDGIAEKLKSLFCLFAGHLVANIAGILDANNVIKTDKPFFEDSHNKEKSASLLGYALDCLHKCFHYDKGDFVSKERFEKLMQPLVDQIENTQGGDDVYQERITSHLTPCIVQFMVAARDPSTWQPLNYQILLKTRNSFPKVRYAALSVLQSVHSQLGEDYLSLLPETIPFLAELMEDESEEVEQRCQDVVSELEKTLGEPLQKYF